MTTRNYSDERRWANTDPSLHYNHSEPVKPDWRQEYIRLLKIREYEAAELLKSQNMVSEECRNGGCGDCHFRNCDCPHHSEVQFRLEHPHLRSIVEIEMDREELINALG